MPAWDGVRSVLLDWAVSLSSGQVSAIADVGLLVVAIIAACVTGHQIRAARRIQRESNARGAYSDLLNLDHQFPRYANPNFQIILAQGEFAAYSSYCSNLFVTLNDILENCTRKERETWEQSALYQFAWHASFIKSRYFEYGQNYYDESMVVLFRKAASDPIQFLGADHEFWNDRAAFLPAAPPPSKTAQPEESSTLTPQFVESGASA